MKGIYILIIKLKKSVNIKTNSKKFNLDKGLYAYMGSAQNNLEKRIQRHLSNKKKMHWHIDYLLKNKNAKIIRVLYKKAGKEQECVTAEKLLKNSLPIEKFGSSDCKCKSHLIKINNSLGLNPNFKTYKFLRD